MTQLAFEGVEPPPPPKPPVHVVELGSEATRCGLNKWRTTPIVFAHALAMHQQGWGLVVCPDCETAA